MGIRAGDRDEWPVVIWSLAGDLALATKDTPLGGACICTSYSVFAGHAYDWSFVT